MSIHTFYISPTQPIFQTVNEHVSDFFQEQADSVSPTHQKEILLVLVEAIQNARIHSGQAQEVKCELSTTPYQMLIRVFDHNPPFSLDRKIAMPDDPFAENGRGLAIIQQLVDYAAVEPVDGGNCLTLLKTFKSDMVRNRDDVLLDLLYEISESIVQTQEVNFERIYELVLDRAIDIFGVDRASIMTLDPGSGELKIIASRGLPLDVIGKVRVLPGEGISGRVFQEAQPMLVDRRGAHGDSVYKSESFISAPLLCSPMRMGGTCMGVINITERRNRVPFDEKDLKLLTTLANQTAAYIRIGQLIDQLKQSQKMEQELDLARNIQRGLLPRDALQFANAEVFGHCEMARQVGGDYFDYIVSGPYLYLVVADVSGHNLPAALTMIGFRSFLRSQLSLGGTPREILTRANRQIYDDLIVNEQQITVALVRLDFSTRTILYANAGHHPLLYLSREDTRATRWFADGILLGFTPETDFEELTRVWEPSDSLLLYTDGVLDAQNAEQKSFGLNQLENLFIKTRTLAPKQSIRRLFKELHRHIGTRSLDDDLTVMLLSLS